MKTEKQLLKEKERIEKQLEEIRLKKEKQDFTDIKFKNKIFRIVKWENKIISDLISEDFKCKLFKDFELARFWEFNELIESKKLELEVWKYYYTKHFNKLQWNKEYCLSWVCLDWDGDLDARDDDLAGSVDYGRVVLVKEELKNELK